MKYVWAASKPFLLYPFLFFTRTLGYWDTVKEGAWTDALENAPYKVRERLGKIYLALLFVDYLVITFVKVRLPLIFRRTLVCDRYVYDLLMEVALSGFHATLFSRLMPHLAPEPNIVFFVNASPKLIIERRPTFSEVDIRAKQQVYQNLARMFGFKTIDTRNGFEENQNYIRNQTLLAMGTVG